MHLSYQGSCKIIFFKKNLSLIVIEYISDRILDIMTKIHIILQKRYLSIPNKKGYFGHLCFA